MQGGLHFFTHLVVVAVSFTFFFNPIFRKVKQKAIIIKYEHTKIHIYLGLNCLYLSKTTAHLLSYLVPLLGTQ